MSTESTTDVPGVASPDLLEVSASVSPSDFRVFLKLLGFKDEGWIDERGNFWPCDEHMQHGFIASHVLDCPEKDAETEADRRGWLRISDYGNRTTARRLNQRQRNTLFDYCQRLP